MTAPSHMHLYARWVSSGWCLCGSWEGGLLQEDMAGLTQPLRGCPPGERGAEASACSLLPAPGTQRMPRARRDVPASEPCCWACDDDWPQCPEECTLRRRGVRASSTRLSQSGHAERGCTSARTGGARAEPVSPFRVLGWRTASTWGDVAATVAPGASLCWSRRAEKGHVAASPVPAEWGSFCCCLGRATRTAAQSSGPRPYQHTVSVAWWAKYSLLRVRFSELKSG